MPQITVDYSREMSHTFERDAFARALHATVVEVAAARLDACKTQFRQAEETVYASGGEGEAKRHVVFHVTLALLPGRTEETKEKLTEAVLDVVRAHVAEDDFVLHASAEVRELGPSYRKFER